MGCGVGVVWVWVVVVVVGCDCGGWMSLDVVVVVGWQMLLPWEVFGLFGVTWPLPSLNGTYLPDVQNKLALVV